MINGRSYKEVTHDLELESSILSSNPMSPSNSKNAIIVNEELLIEEFMFSFINANLFYLENNIKEMPFVSKYKYKPEYVSVELYGTPVCAYLVLYFNTAQSRREFTSENLNGTIRYVSESA